MLDTDVAVRDRYSAAAQAREVELCCPVDYDAKYLKIIPQEVIDRDYGCGDPSKFVREGETVLDLGSGGGKICFIASQVVGKTGRVIGVDMNDTMLDLARRSQPVVAEAVGYDNVVFRKGKIQDLAIDRDAVDEFLKANPVADEAGLQRLESFLTDMRHQNPMIADNSIDVVVSNCVLNLVSSDEKAQLFREIFRVLKPGGRAVISDIVSDEPVPIEMQRDATLWSGCISGAFEQREFLQAFTDAGFFGIEMPVLQSEPWQVVGGIEFRSATVIAYKHVIDAAEPEDHGVIYRGPFDYVSDDDGQVFVRGEPTAVSKSRLTALTSGTFGDSFIGLTGQGEPIAQDAPEKQPAKMSVLGDDCCGSQGCC